MMIPLMHTVMMLLSAGCVVYIMLMLDRTSKMLINKHHSTGHLPEPLTPEVGLPGLSGNVAGSRHLLAERTSTNATWYHKPLLEPVIDCSVPHTVVMYVLTTARARESRDVIRDTWGDVASWDNQEGNPFHMGLVFVMGVSWVDDGSQWNDTFRNLHEENSVNNDLLVGDFNDSYDSLPLKGMVFLKWLQQKCSPENLDYVFKTDDDVFVNMYQLIAYMNQSMNTPRPCHFLCNRFQHIKVPRDGKWAVSVADYPEEEFKPYCQGLGYVLCRASLPIIWRSIDAVSSTPFRLEDIYLTSLIIEKAFGGEYIETLEYHRLPHKLVVQWPQAWSQDRLYSFIMVHRLPAQVWSFLQESLKVHYGDNGPGSPYNGPGSPYNSPGLPHPSESESDRVWQTVSATIREYVTEMKNT